MMMDTDDLELATVTRASTAARMPLQGGLVDASVATGVAASAAQDRLSDKAEHAGTLVDCSHLRLVIDALVVAGIALTLCLLAYHTDNAALPFIFLVLGAFATFEYAWLAYRLRIRLYLPFKLHQKHTCRDIYGQIMSYTVDLNTCAITPWAERAFHGHRKHRSGSGRDRRGCDRCAARVAVDVARRRHRVRRDRGLSQRLVHRARSKPS
ncbi:hypothetical protein PINS_up021883 [Pythium insidiosum]|nr:hypothetical protein PINS_up021883 [Pythium insidiosum]